VTTDCLVFGSLFSLQFFCLNWKLKQQQSEDWPLKLSAEKQSEERFENSLALKVTPI
jgi:hypothetical protein